MVSLIKREKIVEFGTPFEVFCHFQYRMAS